MMGQWKRAVCQWKHVSCSNRVCQVKINYNHVQHSKQLTNISVYICTIHTNPLWTMWMPSRVQCRRRNTHQKTRKVEYVMRITFDIVSKESRSILFLPATTIHITVQFGFQFRLCVPYIYKHTHIHTHTGTHTHAGTHVRGIFNIDDDAHALRATHPTEKRHTQHSRIWKIISKYSSRMRAQGEWVKFHLNSLRNAASSFLFSILHSYRILWYCQQCLCVCVCLCGWIGARWRRFFLFSFVFHFFASRARWVKQKLCVCVCWWPLFSIWISMIREGKAASPHIHSTI